MPSIWEVIHAWTAMAFSTEARLRQCLLTTLTVAPSAQERVSIVRTSEVLHSTAFVVLACLTVSRRASAQDDCTWRGTSFYCDGECQAGESEMTRASGDPGIVLNGSVTPVPFGAGCLFGSKALCCKTPRSTCRWDGTAPFCDGECKSSERKETPPPGSVSGASCWSGDKVYCCTAAPVSSIPQRLVSCESNQAVCGATCCAAGTHCCGDTCCDTPCCGNACCNLLPPPVEHPPVRHSSQCLRGVACGEFCCAAGLKCCGVQSNGQPDCKTGCLH